MKEINPMNLEALPNELILDLFVYFDGIELFHTFENLNIRFNLLLSKQYRFYCFKFQSISKYHFDRICQQYFPIIADKVIALRLSNSDETPKQIDLFFSYKSLLNQFTHLRSLKLFCLYTFERLSKLIDQCHDLPNLTHLNFYCYCYEDDQDQFQSIVNKVWNLPKLIYCYFGIVINERKKFCLPTIISSSIQYLIIYPCELQMNQINPLFEYTPRLKYLSTSIMNSNNENYNASLLPTLIRLKIGSIYSSDIWKAILFLQNIPNLRHLDINIFFEFIDGHQWKQIIENYLPKLKTFALKMHHTLSFDENINESADRLINSFRNSFWIVQHQWFVRCLTKHRTIYLHTLSNGSNYHQVMPPDSWRSTHSHDNQPKEFHDNRISIYDETFFDQPISPHIRFSNIVSLHIKLSLNDQFWSSCPNLNQLRSLTISSHADTHQSQVQTLLDRAIHLKELVLQQVALLSLQTSIFKYTSKSIRQLNLIDCNYCFNEYECMTFTRSALAIQCEVLSIWINHRQIIINLINNMHNLRALIVKYTNKNHDDLIQWLKIRLSPTSLITDDSYHISIWI